MKNKIISSFYKKTHRQQKALMVRMFVAILLVILGSLFVPAFAENGDIAGTIYSTDILTFVNGKAAEGYNIGGKTAVIIEDFDNKGYGIYHNYIDEERCLYVSAVWNKPDISSYEPEIERAVPGKVLGNIYETDIKVILNGRETNGYNLGGKTAVLIEDIGTVYSNPNEDYGYSEYLCNFEWSEEERTVKLNFVEGCEISIIGSPLAITTPSVKFEQRDNVLYASYDPLNEYRSRIYSYETSEEFKAEPNVLKPLYMDIDGEKHEIGLCYATMEGETQILVRETEKADSLLKALMPEPMTASETLNLFDDGKKYKTLDRLEMEDFYFIVVDDLGIEEDRNDIMYISVKKTGGYALINSSSSNYTERTLEKTGINTVSVVVAPFAGPHGATKMRMEFNLNDYIF